MSSINDINKIYRFEEIPTDGFMCDLLWADPIDDNKAAKTDFVPNIERQCSNKYGLKPVKKILEKDDLTLLIRAYQV